LLDAYAKFSYLQTTRTSYQINLQKQNNLKQQVTIRN